jgi:hypothetical protein
MTKLSLTEFLILDAMAGEEEIKLPKNAGHLVSRNKREGFYTGKHRGVAPENKLWYDCSVSELGVKHYRSKLGFNALKERGK